MTWQTEWAPHTKGSLPPYVMTWQTEWAPGVFRARPPFPTSLAEQDAETQIDVFMTEV